MVVFVAITPSIEVVFTMSTISRSWLSLKSGAIFNKIGLRFDFLSFSCCKASSNLVSGSLSCKSLRFGVFGELTLTTNNLHKEIRLQS